jgi:N-sulfoglucosamine sulfohydrolase
MNDIGPYGSKVVKTPHLDQLSEESLLFTRTFAGSPTCGPSRSTLFTGLLPLLAQVVGIIIGSPEFQRK